MNAYKHPTGEIVKCQTGYIVKSPSTLSHWAPTIQKALALLDWIWSLSYE